MIVVVTALSVGRCPLTLAHAYPLVSEAFHGSSSTIIPREPEVLTESKAEDAVTTIRMTAEIEHLLSQLDPSEAEVLKLRFGPDRGEPRTLQEVAHHLELKPSRIAQIEKRALERLRSASE
ncbi:MAG: sigma factor-like helix-turn-helix DNA-binding protein [Acidimicrobiales bacterium]